MTHMCIGIDPGASGGISSILKTDLGNIIGILKPFKSIDEANSSIKVCLEYQPSTVIACIENVHAFPTDGRSSAFKFGKNAGIWEGLLTAHKIPFTKVVPHQWMSHFGEMPKKKDERKKHLKSIAQDILDKNESKYKATLKTADAFLIAQYITDKEEEWQTG